MTIFLHIFSMSSATNELLQHLSKSAFETFKSSPGLSRHLQSIFSNVHHSNGYKSSNNDKRRVCLACDSIFIPGLNCSVRISRKFSRIPGCKVIDLRDVGDEIRVNNLEYTCRVCAAVTILSGIKKDHLKQYDDSVYKRSMKAVQPSSILKPSPSKASHPTASKLNAKKKGRNNLKSLIAKSKESMEQGERSQYSISDFLSSVPKNILEK